MNADACQFLFNPRDQRIAWRQSAGKSPTVVFLCGFKSSMLGDKARALQEWCQQYECSFVRFDYTGHGESDGAFTDGCIGDWLDDTISVIDQLTDGPLILAGSSMGAWIMLLAALKRPDRIAGLLGIASAADFTELLYTERLTATEREALVQNGQVERPSAYDDTPYIYTRKLVEEGRKHLLLSSEIPIQVPVRLIHSLDDPDVPWQVSRKIVEKLVTPDARLTLLKDAGHRLSRPQDIALILSELKQLIRLD